MKTKFTTLLALPFFTIAAVVAGPAEDFKQASSLQSSAKTPAQEAKVAELFKKAADAGHAGACGRMGLLYAEGIGVPQDFDKAFAYFSKGVGQGDAQSLHGLGVCYSRGLGVKRNPLQAIEYFNRAAALNFPKAFMALSSTYYLGDGVEESQKLSLQYAKRAADLGHEPAYVQLALLYRRGVDGVHDYAKAFEYSEKASKLGLAEGYVELGALYIDGLHVEKDVEKAQALFRKAADMGNADGMYSVAIYHLYHTETTEDNDEGLRYLEQAAALHDMYALNKLAEIYRHGTWVNSDKVKAIEYYKLAHACGHTKAGSELAFVYLYYMNNGEAALPYVQECYKFKQPVGAALLGWMYRDGMGVAQDAKRGMALLEEGAAAGAPLAYYQLGCSYLDAKGVARDEKKAREYFEKALSLDANLALYDLARLYLDQGDEKKGIALLKQSVKKTFDARSKSMLAYYFRVGGEGVEPDLLMAAQLHRDALMDGDSTAARVDADMEAKFDKVLDQVGQNEPYLDDLAQVAQMGYLPAIELYGATMLRMDVDKALALLDIACKLGSRRAHYHLGMHYTHYHDAKRAFVHFEQAANKMFPEAIFELACCYRDGKGVAKDEAKAMQLFKVAANLGQQDAVKLLEASSVNS